MAQNRKKTIRPPRKLTRTEAAALNRQLAEAKRQAAKLMAAHNRLSPLAQYEFYNLLLADQVTFVGRLHQQKERFREMVRYIRANHRRGPAAQHARTAERDDEIVRLRDVEKLSFGQIPRRLLNKNAAWGNADGSPLSRDATEKVYYRRKGRA